MDIGRSTFLSKEFLKSVWANEFSEFSGSNGEAELISKLKVWSQRADIGETSSESAFITSFFEELWGYSYSGRDGKDAEYNLYPQFPVKGAGQKGGTGKADLAIGLFKDHEASVPQVLAEFKDIKSNLDAYQNRKGNNRSPVKQALDYLSSSRREMFGNEPILPTWAIVSDMNEFRLYWFDRAPEQYFSFVIERQDLLQGNSLLDDNDSASFDRFLFLKLFHKDSLLTSGGKSALEQLISRQWVQQKELETVFYKDYRSFREALYQVLVDENPDFEGTKGRLVRVAQKILDRCIFIFYCEDMGTALNYPPQLLRNLLIHDSKDEYFDPDGFTVWERLRSLFKAMNDGSRFSNHNINQFNGGLFVFDPEIDSLKIPNHIFCVAGQGQNEATLYGAKNTLLYLSAAYNYASDGLQAAQSHTPQLGDKTKNDPSKSLGLYTLGRIFEQSITELEILEAKADGLLSINEESKRKRDGVYYTPEWVVDKIVHLTISPRLEEIKRKCGWPDSEEKYPSQEAIESYRSKLRNIKIVDPACGSGAFLITSLRYLMTEWHALRGLEEAAAIDSLSKAKSQSKSQKQAKAELRASRRVRDDATLINDILKENIYGVDINPASVEIARLALWLHTARGDKPLSSLEGTIKTGNSLIGPDFYEGRMDLDQYDEDQRERINAFDWQSNFPEVFENDGFDIVVGNPPYVKLQNFRKVHADMAAYLQRRADGSISYESTQTGNFDLYLPFIEQGLRLLNENGRMGYICPSLWEMNDYGAGLRRLIMQGRNLEAWINFRAFQIFNEATTYTALQFFTKKPNDTVKIAFAPDGEIGEDPWNSERGDNEIYYDQIEFGDRWLLLSGDERNLIDGLYQRCKRLDDESVTTQIYQGLITSCDPIYHLKRLKKDTYLCTPKGKNAPPPYEVEIEDEIMHPLVSGEHAKRYTEPKTDIYILFPYEHHDEKMRLIPAEKMARDFPKAWSYLKSYKDKLRGRENGKLDDEEWYRFGRSQSLDKQEIPKLLIPRLVAELQCSIDLQGQYFLDNVDVGGLSVSEVSSLSFVAGLMNSEVLNFVFKRISKPFRGGYLSANKQFIAPLPVPEVNDAQRNSVGQQAEKLQELTSERRDLVENISKRLGALKFKKRPIQWLLPDLPSLEELDEAAPSKFDNGEKRAWVKQMLDDAVTAKYEEITEALHPTAILSASFKDGELMFLIDDVPLISKIWLDEKDGEFIQAQWGVFAASFNITEKTSGKKLCDELLKIGDTDNEALRNQIMQMQLQLANLDADIADKESILDDEIFGLYGLTEEEIELVRSDRL